MFHTDQRGEGELGEGSSRSYIPLVIFLVGIAAWALLRSPLFVDKQPEVVGLHALKADSILRLADLGRPVHLLSVKPGTVEARVEANPWVSAAHLHRAWPNHLVVEVEERVPVARVVLGGVPFPVDDRGVLLPPIQTEAFGPLPLITGVNVTGAEVGRPLSNDNVHAAITVAKGLGPSLRMQASEIRVELGARVVLYMRGDWEAKVGTAEDLELKLQVLQAVERHARAQGFNLTSIDVRSPLQPVVGTRSARAR